MLYQDKTKTPGNIVQGYQIYIAGHSGQKIPKIKTYDTFRTFLKKTFLTVLVRQICQYSFLSPLQKSTENLFLSLVIKKNYGFMKKQDLVQIVRRPSANDKET